MNCVWREFYQGHAAACTPLTEDWLSSSISGSSVGRGGESGECDGVVWKEEDFCLASQVNQIYPGKQWVTDMARRKPRGGTGRSGWDRSCGWRVIHERRIKKYIFKMNLIFKHLLKK